MFKKTSILFLLCLALPLGAWAENPLPSMGEQAESSLDAIKKANKYSFDTGGIGVLMSYGTKNGVSAEYVGDSFVNEITRRGFKARYYFYTTKREGIAIEFHIRYSAMGPWNVDYAASQISKVVARAKAAQNVHGW